MKLSNFLAQRKISHGDFAAIIGMSQVSVTRYANGTRMPRSAHMAAIFEATGGAVTANDFHGIAAELAREDAPAPAREVAA